jgi:hypothetical protein
MRAVAGLIMCLSLAVLFAACSSRTLESPSAPASGFPRLPAPSQLATKSTSAPADTIDGSAFDSTLPLANVTADDTSARFNPMLEPDSQSLDALAFAIYRMDLTGITGRNLRVRYSTPSYYWPGVFVGLADVAGDHWEWFAVGGSGSALIGPEHIAGDGTVLAAVVCSTIGELVVDELTVNAYDEIEDNDSSETGQPLPAGNFSGFRASLGDHPFVEWEPWTYVGYDGDLTDWYVIDRPDLLDGGNITIRIDIDESSAGEFTSLFAEMSTAQGVSEFWETDIFLNSDGVISEDFSDGDLSAADFPLRLRVVGHNPDSDYCDYTLSIAEGAEPYIASLTADPPVTGTVPGTSTFTVTLDTPGSSPIARFEWYLHQTGQPVNLAQDEPVAVTSGPSLTHSFKQQGVFSMTVFAYNGEGLQDYETATVLAGVNPYDEVEDNDWTDFAQLLDEAKSQTGWTGSIGRETPVPPDFEIDYFGYDGDADDYFYLPLQSDEDLIVFPELTSGVGEVLVGFQPRLFSEPPFGVTQTAFGSTGQQWRSTSPGAGDLIIQVGPGDDSYGDYKLTWVRGKAPHSPNIVMSADSGTAPLTVDFTGSAVDDDGTIARIIWDFGQEEPNVPTIDAEGANVSHTFTEPGLYFIYMTAFDEDGFFTDFYQDTVQVN